MSKKKIDSKKLKKYLILTLILIVILSICIIISIIFKKSAKNETSTNNIDGFTITSENGEKINVSNKIKENKNIEGLDFSNIKITTKSNETIVTGTVSNPSSETIKGFYFELIALNELNESIATTNGLLDSEIEAGKSTQFEIKTSKDFSNCYDIKIIKIKDAD